jgi:hypothetical protein
MYAACKFHSSIRKIYGAYGFCIWIRKMRPMVLEMAASDWIHKMHDLYELRIWIPQCMLLVNYASESTKCTALKNSASESTKYTRTARTTSAYESIICTVFSEGYIWFMKVRIHTFINWHVLLVPFHKLQYFKDNGSHFIKYILFPNKTGANYFDKSQKFSLWQLHLTVHWHAER